MYYKIVNKDSEVYKKLHEMRKKEIRYERENEKAIAEKSGLKWVTYLGHSGQQNFNRVTEYHGFEFTEPEKVDLKIWALSKDHKNIYVPNRKTKLGREMSEFLNNGLKGNGYSTVFKILNLEYYGRFVLPYVEIIGDIIILFLDNKQIPTDENIIEITSVEFNALNK